MKWTAPTQRETLTVLAGTAVFVAVNALCIGLRPDHWLLAGLFCGLFFASPFTRRLAVALLPFAVFAISYDWMRIVPNYEVNPIDTRPLYEAERALFGINIEGQTIIPGEYFNQHNWAVADLLAGVFYLCWVPVPIAFGVWLYLRGRQRDYLRFALCFLFVNVIGFCGYYIHPAAPPWYVINYGFDPILSTPGNIAGLVRFEQLTGLSVFTNIYVNNSNIFAAIPSLHAAYMLIALVYACLCRQPRWMIALFAVITLGIWCTAVYSCHHYIIDVLLGILTALLGIFIFECGLMRIPPFRRFIDRYTAFISK